MRVLMLSLDKSLLGEQSRGRFGQVGDSVRRHRRYGELVDKLNIIVTSPPGYSHLDLSDKVEVYPTNSKSIFGHFKAAGNLAESFKSHGGLDLVVAQDLFAPAALKIRKKYNIPYIVTFHAAGFDTPEWRKKIKIRILLPFIKRAVKQADGLRVVSARMKKDFARLGLGCPIAVIPTPINIEKFAADYTMAAQQVRQKYNNQHLILYAGRLVPVKNLDLLMSAFKIVAEKIDNTKLLIIGSGSLEQKLKQKAEEFKIRSQVEFIDSLTYQHLPPYFQAADCIVLSSDSESLGQVLIQAGAAGKPVVATKTLGAQGIVKNGKTGYLVDIGDERALADKIIKLLESDGLRQEMGTQARDHILKNYNSEKNIKKLIEFWKEVTKK